MPKNYTIRIDELGNKVRDRKTKIATDCSKYRAVELPMPIIVGVEPIVQYREQKDKPTTERKSKGKCFYCERAFGVTYNSHKLIKTKDHVLPKSLGGTDSSSNLKPCCQECNGLKANMKVGEFAELMQVLYDEYKDSPRRKIPFRGVKLTKSIMKIIYKNASHLSNHPSNKRK